MRMRLAAAALLGAVAVGCAKRLPLTPSYTVLDTAPAEEVGEPQYRVASNAGATLVSIFAGKKPTGGYTIAVTSVDRSAVRCIVRYRVDAPAPDAVVASMLTYPAVTVRISPGCTEAEVDPPLPHRPAQ